MVKKTKIFSNLSDKLQYNEHSVKIKLKAEVQMELKQEKIQTFCQVCKRESFGTTIFCLFWKVIFRNQYLVRTKAKSIASENMRKTLYLHTNFKQGQVFLQVNGINISKYFLLVCKHEQFLNSYFLSYSQNFYK